MKLSKIFLLLLILPLFAFNAMHKYYISVTQIDYVAEQESLQIISRVFIDDFENALKAIYDENIALAEKDEAEIIDTYINQYLQDKIKLSINNKPVTSVFIGKAYEGDIVKCYLEVENVKHIKTFSITNRMLFDVYKEQQNIVKTKINSKNKSVILTYNKANALLKFN